MTKKLKLPTIYEVVVRFSSKRAAKGYTQFLNEYPHPDQRLVEYREVKV